MDASEAWLQADRRALNITLNSIGTELTRDDRRKLYSNFGLLYPHGHYELAGAEDFDQIRSAMEKCPPYQAIFTKVCCPGTNVILCYARCWLDCGPRHVCNDHSVCWTDMFVVLCAMCQTHIEAA